MGISQFEACRRMKNVGISAAEACAFFDLIIKTFDDENGCLVIARTCSAMEKQDALCKKLGLNPPNPPAFMVLAAVKSVIEERAELSKETKLAIIHLYLDGVDEDPRQHLLHETAAKAPGF